MPISSKAENEVISSECSETIPQGSTCQVAGKRQAPNEWGDDIVRSSWKREAVLKKMISKCKVTSNGCWEWQGATRGPSAKSQYGYMSFPWFNDGKKASAHRLSYVVYNKESIKPGINVCHKCDNPKCFNPDHLFLGTQKDNLADCAAKGRTACGSDNGNSKYTAKDLELVKKLLRDGKTGVEINKITGVSRTHISRIKKGEAWKKDTDTVIAAHGNRKYTDEQLDMVASMITETNFSDTHIAKLAGVTRYTVADMKKGKANQAFLKRVAA